MARARIALGAEEVAPLVGVSAGPRIRAAKTGQIPALKIGKRWRFSLEAVKAALATPLPPDPPPSPPNRPLYVYRAPQVIRRRAPNRKQ